MEELIDRKRSWWKRDAVPTDTGVSVGTGTHPRAKLWQRNANWKRERLAFGYGGTELSVNSAEFRFSDGYVHGVCVERPKCTSMLVKKNDTISQQIS